MSSNFRDDSLLSLEEPLQEIYSFDSGRYRFYRQRRFGVLHFVKKIAPDYLGDLVTEESLKKEFQIGYGLNHPAIVRYLSYENGCLYEEYIEGDTLRELIDSKDLRLRKPYFIKNLCRQLLEGMAYLHDNGLVHLDLKPENIMITRIGENVKIIDLGAAVSSSFDSTPGFTTSYRAPEQIEGTPDHRTDIYQSGLIIKELAEAGGNASTWRKFIDKATQSDPAHRFDSCREALKSLPSSKNSNKLLIFFITLGFILFCAAIIWRYVERKDSEETAYKVDQVIPATVETSRPSQPDDSTKGVNKKEETEIDSPAAKGVVKKEDTGNVKTGYQPSLRRNIENEVERIFDQGVKRTVMTWSLTESGKIPEDRLNEYFKLLGKSYDKAEAYGETLALKYPERRNEIETAVRQTSENVVNRLHRKYYYN